MSPKLQSTIQFFIVFSSDLGEPFEKKLASPPEIYPCFPNGPLFVFVMVFWLVGLVSLSFWSNVWDCSLVVFFNRTMTEATYMSRRAKNRNGRNYLEIGEWRSSEPFPAVRIPPFLSKADFCSSIKTCSIPIQPWIESDLEQLKAGVTWNLQNSFWQAWNVNFITQKRTITTNICMTVAIS